VVTSLARYKRHEVQKRWEADLLAWACYNCLSVRLAVFYLSSIVIGGFSGIIGKLLNLLYLKLTCHIEGYAITFLKGKGGLNSWNWIFVCDCQLIDPSS
jgi:hypothetical protein